MEKIEIPEGKEIDFKKSNIVFKDKIDEKEKLFLELFQGLQIKSDVKKYPDSVFYFKGNTLMLEIESDCLWVNDEYIWSIFEDKFDMKYLEVESFVKEMVKKHFKWNGFSYVSADRSYPHKVEKHFKESNN